MTTAYRKTSPAASVGHHTAEERHVMDYVRTFTGAAGLPFLCSCWSSWPGR